MGDDCMWVFVGSFWAAVFGFMVFEISFLPKRKWVGLTDEECVAAISDLFDAALMDGNVPNEIVIEYARTIEAKLKEKNT